MSMGMVWVESHRQLVNGDVDDDQRWNKKNHKLILGKTQNLQSLS